MLGFERLARRIDRFQRGRRPVAVPFAVLKKFGDDNGGTLAANLAFSAFTTVFPLLLLLVTISGIVFGHDRALRDRVLHSALTEFPVVGNQLGRNIHAIQRSSAPALAIALVFLVWSSTSLAQSGLFTMAQVWNLPGSARPGFVQRLGRSVAFLAALAVGIGVSSALVTVGQVAHGPALFVAVEAGALAVNVGQYALAFRVLTPHAVPTRRLWPGVVAGGAAWTVLQSVGGYLVAHSLKNQSAVYGTFAVTLGLLAWVYLATRVTVYAAELNTVLAHRLWPRSLVQPPLTAADKRSLELQIEMNTRRRDELVTVSFGPESDRPPPGA